MRAAVVDSARFVLQDRLGREPVTEPTLDRESVLADELRRDGGQWRDLAHSPHRRRRRGARRRAGDPESVLPRALGGPIALYSDVAVGLGSVMAVARNLLRPP